MIGFVSLTDASKHNAADQRARNIRFLPRDLIYQLPGSLSTGWLDSQIRVLMFSAREIPLTYLSSPRSYLNIQVS